MQSEVSGDDETLRTEVKKKCPQLFQETGALPGVHSIVLNDDATGVVHAPRRVAVDKRSQLKKELLPSLLPMFNIPYGRYRYFRLTMGTCFVPEVFHKTVHQFLQDCKGVSVYLDDIIVWGSTVEEHDQHLTENTTSLV